MSRHSPVRPSKASFKDENQVRVPLVSSSSSLGQALAVMKSRRRSGIVASDGGQYWLFDAPTVVIAVSEHGPDMPLLDLLDRQPVHPAEPARPELTTKRALRHWLDRFGVRYAIFGTSQLSVTIATYSETLRMALEPSPQDCYCKVDKKPVPNGRTGGNCGTPGHTGSVRCV